MKLKILIALAIASLMLAVAPATAAPRGKATTAKNKSAAATAASDEVLEVAEEMPQFPGGQGAMIEWIQKNIKYPEAAKHLTKTERVMVKFIVTKDGSVKDAKVVRSVNPELDKEALRLVRKMPKFTPGKQDGKPVNVAYILPIAFVPRN